jgi:hypothetical protein
MIKITKVIFSICIIFLPFITGKSKINPKPLICVVLIYSDSLVKYQNYRMAVPKELGTGVSAVMDTNMVAAVMIQYLHFCRNNP